MNETVTDTTDETLILLFHPDPARSKANAALAAAARAVPGIRIVDMRARHPDLRIDAYTDAAADAEMLLGARRIVLQFPMQWYSTPALLKAWQDAVLTRMYYIRPDTEGDRLSGTPLMIAVTAGNTADAYVRGGVNAYSVDELFAPLKATAHRCGLPWHAPYCVFIADRLSPDALAHAADGYVAALRGFIAATPAGLTGREAAQTMTDRIHDTLTTLDRGTPALFVWSARLLPIVLALQFLLAGQALFGGLPWGFHAAAGGLASLPLLVMVACAAAIPRLTGFAWWADVTLVLYIVQVGLATANPALLAFHPFNGALLLVASLVLVAKVERRRARHA